MTESSPDAPRAHLPLPLSDFIGRQAELLALRQEFDDGARLVTLTGPGGVGKTRLALEYCAQARTAFPGPLHFVSLQPLSDASQVLNALAAALEVRESGSRPLLDDLTDALAARPALLCIDNWEHVVEAAPQLAQLLRACPQVRVLATSREALRLQGEREFRVAPLPVPAGDLSADALQLFAARASAVRRDFQLNESNAPTVAAICALLDGLPLAIELAAALMRLFSPQALLARLQAAPGLTDRPPALRLLAGGPRDLPARHQTLQATIAWSYDLLPSHEQRLFRRLSVFAGGCDLEAAEALCADPDAPIPPLDGLLALVDKNLLTVEQVDGEPRFAMLRTIQDFARERLDQCGETSALRLQHTQVYLAFVERAVPELKGAGQAEWLKRIEREHDNLRAAIQWSLDRGHAETACRLVGELWRYWLVRGHNREADRWLTAVLAAQADVTPESRIKALNGAGAVAWSLGDLARARERHSECLTLRMRLEDAPGIAASYHNLGIVAHDQLDLDGAVGYFRASVAGYQECGDLWGAADGLLQLGSVLRKQKAYEESQAHLERGIAILTDLGDKQGLAGAHYLLGELIQVTGDDARARAHFMRCKELSAELGYVWGVALAENELGLIALRANDLSQAQLLLTSSLRVKHELGEKMGAAYSLEALACLAALRKDAERAATLLAAAEALRSAIGAPMSDELRAEYAPFLANLPTARRSVARARESGAAMSVNEAVQYALEPAAISSPRSGSGSHPAGLSSREVEVLRLVSQGLTDAEVADRLVLSPRTVNAHLTSIYNKLGVNSRAAATRFAVEHHLL